MKKVYKIGDELEIICPKTIRCNIHRECFDLFSGKVENTHGYTFMSKGAGNAGTELINNRFIYKGTHLERYICEYTDARGITGTLDFHPSVLRRIPNGYDEIHNTLNNISDLLNNKIKEYEK